jgi:hypothetical protein
MNGSYRKLFLEGGRLDLLWRNQKSEQLPNKDEQSEPLRKCPCGCGLIGDLCPPRAALVIKQLKADEKKIKLIKKEMIKNVLDF